MLDGGFSADVREESGEVVVDVCGELDEHTVPRLREALARLAAQDVVNVTLDLARMTFIDSTGLGALVGALKRSRAVGGEVTLRHPSAATRKVLELTGLHNLFNVTDGVARSADSTEVA
jgi:anti-sigma B factor antagonist